MNLFTAQLWKFNNDGTLQNKLLGNWQFYRNTWIIPEIGEIGFIESMQTGVLSLSDNPNSKEIVVMEEKDDENPDQKWQRGPDNKDGFFKIKNMKTHSFLSAKTPTQTITGKGPFKYYLSKIVGGWVRLNAYVFLHGWWV
jgi:hypothetical protein